MQEPSKITSPTGNHTGTTNGSPLHMTATIGLFRGVIDYCRQQNIPIQPVLAAAELCEADLADFDKRIPILHYFLAQEKAQALSGDPDFGIHIGEEVKPGHYGLVGMVAMSCNTARELLDLHLRYQSLVADGVDVEYVDTDEGVELRIHPKIDFMVDSRLHQESTFSSWITMARWITGLKDHFPLRGNFTHPKPDNTEEQHRVFGEHLYWDQPIAGAVFARELLDTPIPQANPALRAQLEAQAKEQLLAAGGNQFDPLLQSVQHHIASHLADGAPDIEAVASELSLSTRALQRKLSDLDTSFSQMLDNTRKELALNYIRKPHISLTEIAFLLGFSEQSAFNRAFKRWTEQAPSVYRKRQNAS